MAEDRKEITLAELEELNKQSPRGVMPQVECKGLVTVFDKNGDVKFKMNITSLET